MKSYEPDPFFIPFVDKNTKADRVKNKYNREIKPGVYVDVYDVLIAFKVTCPAIQHAIKKLLAPGKRGVKSAETDLREAHNSIKRAIELNKDLPESKKSAVGKKQAELSGTEYGAGKLIDNSFRFRDHLFKF